MSSVDILVPDLPESVADATVATWHKKPGDSVERDDVLVEIETDKVVLEVPASEAGILTALSKTKVRRSFPVRSWRVFVRVTAAVSQALRKAPIKKRLLRHATQQHWKKRTTTHSARLSAA